MRWQLFVCRTHGRLDTFTAVPPAPIVCSLDTLLPQFNDTAMVYSSFKHVHALKFCIPQWSSSPILADVRMDWQVLSHDFSASFKEQFPGFNRTRRFVTVFQMSTTFHYPEPDESTPSHPVSLTSILILSPQISHLVTSFRFFRLKCYKHLPLITRMRATCLTHLVLIDRCNNICWRVGSKRCFPPVSRHFIPLRSQIFSSAPCSQTPSIYVPHLWRETKFHTHTKQ
jgi:hypothetical protein